MIKFASSYRGRGREHPDHGQSAQGSERNTILLPLLIAVAIMFGGASAPTSAPAFALQAVSVIFLVIGVLRMSHARGGIARPAWWAGLALLALGLIHITPLPAEIWSSLPGRAIVQESLAVAGSAEFPLAVSLDPQATLSALLALVPAVALVTLFAGAGSIPVSRVTASMVMLVLISCALGVTQFAGGAESALYFHSFTNWGMAVGFFANANHLALLLVIGVPLVAALAGEGVLQDRLSASGAFVVLGLYAGLAALGITLATSIAGIVLLPFAIIFSSLLIPSSKKVKLLVVVSSVSGAGAAVVVSAGVLGTNFDRETGRLDTWRTTFEGISQFWPLGSGLGTFPATYPLFENHSAVLPKYFNHAHNDYLEWLFEAGLIGAVLIAVGVGWWIVRTIKVWRSGAHQPMWQRAASILVGLVLAHSLVDYPLRTPAMLVIFTFYALVLGHDQPLSRASSAKRE